MATKKKVVKTKNGNGSLHPTKIEPPANEQQPPYEVEGPRFIDGFLHLSANDLIRLDLLLEKVASRQSEQRALTGDIERIKAAANRDIEALMRQKSVVAMQSTKAEAELNAFRQALSRSYEQDFEKVSYDDISGKIFVETSANNRSPVLAPD